MVTKIAIEVTHKPRPGGEIYFRWADCGAEKNINADATGRGDRGEAARALCVRMAGRGEGHSTKVEIILEKREGGTLLRLREYGFLDSDASRKHMVGNASGWGEALTLVKIWLEHGIHYN